MPLPVPRPADLIRILELLNTPGLPECSPGCPLSDKEHQAGMLAVILVRAEHILWHVTDGDTELIDIANNASRIHRASTVEECGCRTRSHPRA